MAGQPLHALLAPRRRVVSVTDTYGGTSKLFTGFLSAWDVDVALVDTDSTGMEDAADLLSALDDALDRV
ncbi:MAG TPA: hypothetical protein VFZ70_15790 [Euzebyales bacterium]